MMVRRDTDMVFALLLLVSGHIALMVRLELGWFDLLLLDLWLVPLWFRKHPKRGTGKEQQSEAHKCGRRGTLSPETLEALRMVFTREARYIAANPAPSSDTPSDEEAA